MTLATSPTQDVHEQTLQARKAQRAWSLLSLRERLRPARKLRQLLFQKADAVCEAVARDLRKEVAESLGSEVLPLADACKFVESEARRLLHPRRVPRRNRPTWLWGQTDTVYRRPRGVVGIIGTWNYPVLLNGVQIIQALTAGNAVLWKPSEVAPASAEVLQDLLLQAGYTPDLFQVLPATREAGMALTEAPMDHVVFTGGANTGRHVARRLGERLISSTMELSGCDAQFVLADADVPLAAKAAWFGVTVNRGQTCIAVRRAFVHRSIYSTFCDALRPLATTDPLPMMLTSQSEQAARLVGQALEEGGHLLVESEGPAVAEKEGCRPVVVIDARPEMALCREASFAPIMAMIPFDTLEEALAMDEQCPYALAASIFTRSSAQAVQLAGRLRAGAVTINDVVLPTAHPATPFGGRGDSGWGSTQGAEGLLEMTVPQVVSQRGGTFRPHFDLAAGGDTGNSEELLRALLQSSHAPGWSQRMSGWWRVLRAAISSGKSGAKEESKGHG